MLARLQHAILLIAALWVGSLWTIGYVVAPTLFTTLTDRALAGTLAAAMFRVEAWVTVASASGITILLYWGNSPSKERTSLLYLIYAMLACTVVGYFGLQPLMASLRRSQATGEMIQSARTYFGLLHSAAAVIFVIQSVLGVFLLSKLNKPRFVNKV